MVDVVGQRLHRHPDHDVICWTHCCADRDAPSPFDERFRYRRVHGRGRGSCAAAKEPAPPAGRLTGRTRRSTSCCHTTVTPGIRRRTTLAVDVTPWLRPDANTTPGRSFCHTYGRGHDQSFVWSTTRTAPCTTCRILCPTTGEPSRQLGTCARPPAYSW
ncbi:MAG TPA: transposase [Pseudonocardiaceae bacterium]|nr:transposase [Pseudonocardiaceae bacterium]